MLDVERSYASFALLVRLSSRNLQRWSSAEVLGIYIPRPIRLGLGKRWDLSHLPIVLYIYVGYYVSGARLLCRAGLGGTYSLVGMKRYWKS